MMSVDEQILGPGNLPLEKFVCPFCMNHGITKIDRNYYCINSDCKYSGTPYLSVEGKPILINFTNSLVDETSFLRDSGESIVVRTSSSIILSIRRFFNGVNTITTGNVSKICNEIQHLHDPKILIVGGGEMGNGMEELYIKFPNKIISFDVYNSAYVKFIADGHFIPTIDEVFDVVIIQAVLEHVLIPQQVVSEIHRVLKTNGIVYAETPFMQQVHEGPYDFIRFSESGHRYLFRDFQLISSGYTAGAGSSLLWSLDFFFSGIFRTRKAGKVIRILFFWLRKFDMLIPRVFNIDAASGNYFYGRKSEIQMHPKKIIDHYMGNQRTKI